MSDMYITPGIIKRLKKMFSRYIEDEDEASEDIPANKIIIRKNQLKKTKTAITAGDTLSSTNLEDVEDGLNLVNDKLNSFYFDIKVGEVSDTTSANGAIGTNVLFDSITLLSCWASNQNCATPYKSNTGYLEFRISSTSSGNWTVVASQARTVYYSYIDKPLPSYGT